MKIGYIFVYNQALQAIKKKSATPRIS